MIADDDALEITAADLLTLVKPDYVNDIHDRSRRAVERHGMTINGSETFDPDFVIGVIELRSLKIGKREIDLE